MNQVNQAAKLREEFHPALEQLMSLANKLVDTIGRMDHGEMEAFIFKDGNEVLRLLLQGCLDLCSKQEERKDSVKGYGAPGVESVFPLDGELNLPKDKYSHGLRRRVVEQVSAHSFDEAVADIENTTGGKVPKRQAEELAVRGAQDFEAFYANRGLQEPDQTSGILVMTVDQKGVVMRKEDLRPATKKAAEKSTSVPGARLSPGEKKNRKRMATVTAVYTTQVQERTPEAIMGLLPQADL